MLLRALLPLAAAAVVAASDAESELTFVDLRAHGGLVASNGRGFAVTLMCGDIGDKEQHVVDMSQDLGIVIGARGIAQHVKAKLDAGPTLEENILGIEACGGVGAYVDPKNLLELVAGYGFGQNSDGTASGFHKRGSTKQLSFELGWYYTMAKHYQVGALVGFEHDSIKYSGSGYKATAQGANAAVELGYRF
jgi:hypothetical protein